MSRIEFHQTNYIAKMQDKTEIKICPICSSNFNVNFDDCPKCGLFLPSFPTSWARSATNIFLLRKILEYIYIDLDSKCDVSTLSDILTQNYIITYDPNRRDDRKYWRGGPMRRASEYLSNLQYLWFVFKIDSKYNLTSDGVALILAKDYSQYIRYFANAFMNLKVGNEFDLSGFYSAYNNHILFQSLRIINDLEERNIHPTIENMALAIMCKDENKEYQKALDTSTKYHYREIKKIWFSRWTEFNRTIKGVFIRWLNQTKIIDIEQRDDTVFLHLTDFGKEVFMKYKEIYMLCYEKSQTKRIEDIVESTIDKRYLRLTISNEINNRAGVLWENIVKDNFNKININVDWYKKTQNFIKIELPAEVLMSLTGWTRHNPDLILQNPLWLIDPKKDVNAEMHKVCAYDKYGGIVNGYCVIVTQKIMRDEKVKMMESLKLKNVLVIDGYALQVLSDNIDYFNREKVISIINDCKNNIHYLNEEMIFDKYVK